MTGAGTGTPLACSSLGNIYMTSDVWFYHSTFPFKTGSLREPGASWLPASPSNPLVSTLRNTVVPGK